MAIQGLSISMRDQSQANLDPDPSDNGPVATPPVPVFHRLRRGALGAGLVIIGLSAIIGTVWLAPSYVFDLGVLLIVILALREIYSLAGVIGANRAYYRLSLILGSLLVLQPVLLSGLPGTLPLTLVFVLLFSSVVLSTRNPDPSEWRDLAIALFGIIYIGGTLGYLIVIREAPLGRQLSTVFILTVWARELGAGLGGILFPHAPPINRALNLHKSWVGAVVGWAAATGMAMASSGIASSGFTTDQSLVFAGAISIACQFGDLAESFLKRAVGSRHSGSVLGPRGGILDTIDAVAFAAVFSYWLLHYWSYV